MTIELIAAPSFWLGMAFITCIFVAMVCLGFMGFAAKSAKGGFFFLPWEGNSLVEEYKRRFPNSLIYRVFSVSAIGGTVFAGLFLIVVVWTVFGAK
jgi:hypothetical protein